MSEPTPELREQIRLAILRYALSPTRRGFIAANLRGEGLRVSDELLDQDLRYLISKGLLETDPRKHISPENPVYTTTATGMDILAAQHS